MKKLFLFISLVLMFFLNLNVYAIDLIPDNPPLPDGKVQIFHSNNAIRIPLGHQDKLC